MLFAGISFACLAGLLCACTSDGSGPSSQDGGADLGDVRIDGADADSGGDTGRDVAPDADPDGGETGPDCSLDSDGDGLNDCVERDLGLNPERQSTFDDGIPDSARWRAHACEPPRDPDEDFTGTIDYYESDTANYKIGLPPGFSNYRQLDLVNASVPIAAGVYGDSLTSVYGFILSKEAEMGRTDPKKSLVDFVRPKIRALAGNQQENLISETNGATFATHNQQQAAIGRYRIETPTERSAGALREELLLGLDAFDQEDIGEPGLPSTDGDPHSRFRISVSVILRDNSSGPAQALISAAVTPASVYESRNQVRFQMDDLTNTTNIAEEVDVTRIGCDEFKPASNAPKAYFYWVLDQSDSMAAENDTIAGLSQGFAEQLRSTQLGFKLGVTNMDPRNRGRLYNPWTTSATQFSTDVRNAAIDCTGWNCAGETAREEKGLQVAREGIRFMRGLGDQTPPAGEAIDANAPVYTVFFTDEHASSVQDDNVPVQTYIDFFNGPGRTTAFSITGTPECAEHGPAYQQVAASTGGTSASVCSENLESILSDIVLSAIAEETKYQLSRVPVSASLSVFRESDEDPRKDEFVPRNRDDGFEYFAQSNSIGLFGHYRMEPSDGEIAEDFIAVRYAYFTDRCVGLCN
jgi:hypothetical protein